MDETQIKTIQLVIAGITFSVAWYGFRYTWLQNLQKKEDEVWGLLSTMKGLLKIASSWASGGPWLEDRNKYEYSNFSNPLRIVFTFDSSLYKKILINPQISVFSNEFIDLYSIVCQQLSNLEQLITRLNTFIFSKPDDLITAVTSNNDSDYKKTIFELNYALHFSGIGDDRQFKLRSNFIKLKELFYKETNELKKKGWKLPSLILFIDSAIIVSISFLLLRLFNIELNNILYISSLAIISILLFLFSKNYNCSKHYLKKLFVFNYSDFESNI